MDPAKLPPDYVSLAQLQERWIQKQQREKDTREKPNEEKERESGLNENRQLRLPPDYVSLAQLQERWLEKETGEKPKEEKPKEEKKERESGINKNRERRLPPDYVSLAQLQERWLEKKQREKETREDRDRESAELSKSDRRDKKASYGDKGKWKEVPIECYGNGEEIKKKIMSNRGKEKGGIQIDKELKLEVETDNGGTKGVLSGENRGDGGLTEEIGNRKNFDRGSGYSSKKGNNYRGGFNQLKETQVHKMEDKKGSNRNWTGKRRNGGNNGDKEGSYRLKEPELEKKLDSENSEICIEMDVIRDRKNAGDDHVVERERLNGEKAEEELVLAVESVKNNNNNNGRKGFGNWINRNKRGGREGSYRLKEPELEKKSANENSEVCSEMDVIRDRKNDSDDDIIERAVLNGKKVMEEMVLAVESVKIGKNGYKNSSYNNGRGEFRNRRNGNNRGAREGSYRLQETELEKKSNNENSKVCRVIDVKSDRKNDSDDHVVERKRLNGKKEEEERILAEESVKIGENGYRRHGNNKGCGFENQRNGNNRGAREGSYRSKELGLEKKSNNDYSEVCSKIGAVRDRKNGGDAHIVEREGLNGKKVIGEMVLAVESVKIGENGYSSNGRRGLGNQRIDKNCGSRDGSYRSKELWLEKNSDNEKSNVCSVISGISDVRDRNIAGDDHIAEREGLNDNVSTKAEEETVLPVEGVGISENGCRRHGNNNGRRFSSYRKANDRVSYRSKELWLEKKLDNEKSKVCSVVSGISDVRDRNIAGNDNIAEREGLNDNVSAKAEEEIVLPMEGVKISENQCRRHGNNNGRRFSSYRKANDGVSYRSKELGLEKKSDNEKSNVCSVISGISDVRDRNIAGDDHIAEREGLNDNVSAKAEEDIILPVEGVRISENGCRRHGNNNGRRSSSYRKANDGGRTRYAGPKIFEGGRETREREMSGMVWVKKEDGSGR